MKIFTYLLLLSFLMSCKPEYDITENAVYFTDAQSKIEKIVTIDELGASTIITSRLARKVDSDVKVNYQINESLLQEYNKINGTNYKMLPADFYTLSDAGEAIIRAGEVTASPIELNIKPYDESFEPSDRFALPIEIQKVDGGVSILQTSAKMLVILNQIIVTDVPYWGKGMNGLSFKPETPIEASQWTLEWNLNLTKYNRNNVTLWNIGGSGTSSVYTRFGDVICDQNQFQAKIGGNIPQSSARFSENKWYHMAFTYDGTNIRLYVDGVLDFTTPHAKAGEVFKFASIAFGNNGGVPLNGYANELRVWTVCRSQAEILNNMYVVSPDSEGLILYWKCNEGEGTKIKDYTKNGWDSSFLGDNVLWKIGQRFPDDGK
ncbi:MULTISPECIES: DUF1735 and LamG domain-containing protein [Bacteroides]|uniref:DUF1735 and LamG domain-containing protein n=1 Tax=Bacteroides TaxID=816 RepID=UPI0004BCDD4F|nr:DUF1735 and LamG domain-containing protein [Bacteroides neonati]